MSSFEAKVLSMLESIQSRIEALEHKVFDGSSGAAESLEAKKPRERLESVDSDLELPWNVASLPPSGAQSVLTALTSEAAASPPRKKQAEHKVASYRGSDAAKTASTTHSAQVALTQAEEHGGEPSGGESKSQSGAPTLPASGGSSHLYSRPGSERSGATEQSSRQDHSSSGLRAGASASAAEHAVTVGSGAPERAAQSGRESPAGKGGGSSGDDGLGDGIIARLEGPLHRPAARPAAPSSTGDEQVYPSPSVAESATTTDEQLLLQSMRDQLPSWQSAGALDSRDTDDGTQQPTPGSSAGTDRKRLVTVGESQLPATEPAPGAAAAAGTPRRKLDLSQLERLGVKISGGAAPAAPAAAVPPPPGTQLDRLLRPGMQGTGQGTGGGHVGVELPPRASIPVSPSAAMAESGASRPPRLGARSVAGETGCDGGGRDRGGLGQRSRPLHRGSVASELSSASTALSLEAGGRKGADGSVAGRSDAQTGSRRPSRAAIEGHLRRWDAEREAQRRWNRQKREILGSLGLGKEVEASIRRLFPLWERAGQPHADRAAFLRGLRNKAVDAAERHGRKIGLRGGPASKARENMARGISSRSGRELLSASGPVRMKGVGEPDADAGTTLIGLPSRGGGKGGDTAGSGSKGPLDDVQLFPGREAHLREVQEVASRVGEAVRVACQGAVKAAVSVEVSRLESFLSDPAVRRVLETAARREGIKRRLLLLQKEAASWDGFSCLVPAGQGSLSGGEVRSSLDFSSSASVASGDTGTQLDRLLGEGASSGSDQMGVGRPGAGGKTGGILGDVSSDAPAESMEVSRRLVMPVRVRVSAQAVAGTRGATAGKSTGGLRRARTALPGSLSSAAKGKGAGGLEAQLSPGRSFRLERRERQLAAEGEATAIRRRGELLQRQYDEATQELLGLARRQELASGGRFRYRGIRVVQAVACERALAADAEAEAARARARRAL